LSLFIEKEAILHFGCISAHPQQRFVSLYLSS